MMNLSQRGALAGVFAAAILCAQHSTAQTNVAPASTNKSIAERSAELFPDVVVAKGKGFEVKRSAVDDAMISYKANLAARNGAPQQPQDVLEAKLLERLVLTQILLSKATAEDKTKAKELTEKYLTDARKQFPSEDVFVSQVKASGLTMDQFQGRVLEQNTCETVLDRELRSKVVITDADLKKFYDENPTEFEQKEQVRASHILLSTLDKDQQPVAEDQKKEKEKLAKELKARADKGEDFAKLAKEYSEDPGSKDNGGEYKFPRGQMVKEFETAAFSLQTNQVSEVVETRFGYHIIKLLEKIPATTLQFTNVSPKLKEYLTDKEFSKQLPAFLDTLKKESNVEILDAKLAQAMPKHEEELQTSTNAPAVTKPEEAVPASTNAAATK